MLTENRSRGTIDLYTWATPNGRKVSILLEELELDYTVTPVNIGTEEQFRPKFLAISPNNKIPAIVDHGTGISLMESGAILLYLAERHGRFLPEETAGRWQAIEWLMWQMGGLGPMAGQAHHFLHFNPGKAAYAETRYAREIRRLYAVLERRLEQRNFIVDDYSIADIACWPWVSRYAWQGIDLNEYPRIRDWYTAIAERPAVQRGYHVPSYITDIPLP